MHVSRGGECLARTIGEDTVLVPLKGHVADLESIFSLNELGSVLWDRIETRMSVDHLVEDVCREYDVTAQEAREDIIAFLEKLERFGLLETYEE